MPNFQTFIAIVTALLVFITRRASQLREHRRQQARQRAFQAERRQNMVESIRILAMAIEENQVEY